MQPSINRHLKDEIFDDIDHALGRPKIPMRETYRDHFECGSDLEAVAMKATGYFEGDGTFLRVTREGRQALSDYLKKHGG